MNAKFHKNRAHWNIETKSAQVFNFGSKSAISNIIFMTNKLDLLWLTNFIALGIYFSSGTKFSWNEGIDTCFNVDVCYFTVILIFLVISACYLVVTACYCSLLGGYWWLLLVTGGYYSLPLVTARSHF